MFGGEVYFVHVQEAEAAGAHSLPGRELLVGSEVAVLMIEHTDGIVGNVCFVGVHGVVFCKDIKK